MVILFLFLDGVGLGSSDPEINPFAKQDMPHLRNLLNGYPMIFDSNLPLVSERATLVALDACLGVDGLPQSATGQATLLTGNNIAEMLGYHYGPKPNLPIREILGNGNLFSRLEDLGLESTFLNAYPPRYFEAIDSGRRLFSAIPLAATKAGIRLKNYDDLKAGKALSADFTAQGWREQLNFSDTPLLSESEAGARLGELSNQNDFALFEYWLSDYAGHSQDMTQATELLISFDQVLGGLLSVWEDEKGLIILTSDHGNIEELRTRRHTTNPVPALLIGDPRLRQSFINYMYAAKGMGVSLDLSCIAPAIVNFLTDNNELPD
jgi:hypothetical protein